MNTSSLAAPGVKAEALGCAGIVAGHARLRRKMQRRARKQAGCTWAPRSRRADGWRELARVFLGVV